MSPGVGIPGPCPGVEMRPLSPGPLSWALKLGADYADTGGVRCLRERDLLEKMGRGMEGSSGLLGNGRDAAGHKGSSWKREQMERLRGFPGGSGVKGPPANAGDVGLVTGPGRPYMPLSLGSGARGWQLLSPHATATEARAPRTSAPQKE